MIKNYLDKVSLLEKNINKGQKKACNIYFIGNGFEN